MSNDVGSPRVIAITGVMAAGKSTVAQRLAQRLPRSAHVRGDVFRRMIVNGGPLMSPDDLDRTDEALRLRYRQAAMAADRYADAGYTAVVQDVVIGPLLSEFVANFATRPLALIVLVVRPEIVAAREDGRDKTGYGDWSIEELDNALRTETPKLGLWLDTSDQTPDETVSEIIARLPESTIA